MTTETVVSAAGIQQVIVSPALAVMIPGAIMGIILGPLLSQCLQEAYYRFTL